MQFRRNYIPGLAIAAFMLVGLVPTKVEKEDTDRPLAIVRRVKPQVVVKHNDKQEWKKVDMGEKLFSSDTLVTRDKGYAAVQFMDKSLVKIKPSSMLIVQGEVKNRTSTAAELALEFGSVFLDVEEQQSSFDVTSGSAVGTVKGTEFGCTVDKKGTTRFWVAQGTVSVQARQTGQTIALNKRMFADITANGNLKETGKLSKSELKELMKEYEDLDQNSVPKTLKLQFKKSDGESKEIDVKYFENNDNDDDDGQN